VASAHAAPRWSRRVAAAAVVLLAAACDGATGPKAVDRVVVVTPSTQISTGTPVQLSATMLDAGGRVLEGRTVTWSSSNELIATVSATGLVTPTRQGAVSISATSEGRSGSINLTVVLGACAAAAGPSITVGQTRVGDLGTAPCRILGTLGAVGHPFTLASTTGIELLLTMTAALPVLHVTTATLQAVDVDPTAYDDTRAVLRAALPAGSYIAWVAAEPLPLPVSVPYTVQMSQNAGDCSAASVATIGLNTTVDASFDHAACILLFGPIAAGWSITVPDATRVRFTATSATMDPVVALTSTALDLIVFDLTFDGSPARITGTLAPGTHYVWTGTFGPTGGSMSLEVEELPPCGPVGTIAVGATVNGALSDASCDFTGRPGALADAWRLTLSEAASVRIDLTSAVIDPYLVVATAAGTLVGEDDDSGTGLNSRLELQLAAGEYDLWAGSFTGSQVGAYQLSVTAIAGGRAEAAARPPGKPRPLVAWPAGVKARR
jgi:hypothetical protein